MPYLRVGIWPLLTSTFPLILANQCLIMGSFPSVNTKGPEHFETFLGWSPHYSNSNNEPSVWQEQDLSPRKKSDVIRERLRALRLSFPDFIKNAVQRPPYKGQMIWALEDKELAPSFMPDRQCLDHAYWSLDEYRRELLALAESRYLVDGQQPK